MTPTTMTTGITTVSITTCKPVHATGPLTNIRVTSGGWRGSDGGDDAGGVNNNAASATDGGRGGGVRR